VQIYRHMYNDVVRLPCPLSYPHDLHGVQIFKSNHFRVVHLRPHKRLQEYVPYDVRKCKCGRTVDNNSRYCCVECKVRFGMPLSARKKIRKIEPRKSPCE
jgi:hypothetical protein